MASPLVTCIVPVWNGEKYLVQALDSIFAQTYRSIEVIVVDDGSTDTTAAIVTADPRPIQYIRQENAGAVVARNRGIAATTGDLITFLDHDDTWVPEKLAWQVAAFTNDANLGACIGQVVEFYEDEDGICVDRTDPIAGYVTSTIMISRAAFDQVGLLDASLRHADTAEWFLRARRAGIREAVLPEVTTLRRRHSTNTSIANNANTHREFLRVIKANLDKTRHTAATNILKQG